MTDFQKAIIEGIPDVLPAPKPFDPTVNHAPHRKQILTADEKKLALRNVFSPETSCGTDSGVQGRT